ncbi:MAG: hypothetical protein A2667_02385 [Candidatus Wildermuthbacteria bacterium RIFCSPHIGHO2_01_FULL_47_27]|uniref:DUF5652 domain-containing protein n=2 Tax=Candidatus Wildermuthiibacteriota TaxID=1817923 RepID=A0A1G2RRM4_9BACT|nr:MAG: hypothetical protein UY15_C0005G0056 [Parcubacteria group bacterium GW2011_GWA2_47_9]OHA64663.1 MAG: hypothetical protein A2667_02385 [Candidatus Wildermuthbacteria bacterium RIFCSPHIGHO2_01_FULL_47_27]OHA67994.1 MAG: hypothetical protein A3D59_02630 [Candidatus Wildermuthbacteria bacterium RIFCSPHIGHO2_02_FULL_47_17]OHA75493.1 MAG: hypothetical protein A3A32_00260 [Candidatus Wildermuthbacteria bacterium RIFCSPLOWO2_01_FULL_48_35]OHA76641.1 MAG: hypothetical protein A3I38_00685 [Candid
MLDALELIFQNNPWLIYVLVAWILPWKGVALWRAARNNHMRWFAVLLVLNTLAILEIAYIFYFAKKKAEEKKS